ncbi:MAG TPA: acetolactate synthase small subunit [Blastocatellia bacterium]|nr:acetolactate synthase small subunit [Blastocatellia bacterium]
MRYTLSILVENRFGELARILGVFTPRGLNVESLTVAETLDPAISRVTLVSEGTPQVIEQVIKQLDKQVRVLKVENMTEVDHIEREMALINVKAEAGPARQEALSLVNIFRAKVVDVSEDGLIIEATGDWKKIRTLINLLKPFGIREIARTGAVAVATLPQQAGVEQLDEAEVSL